VFVARDSGTPHPSSIHSKNLVWNTGCYYSGCVASDSVEQEDAVVNAVLDSSEVRYAVIEGLHTETGPERFVIAYSNEGSLRGLIAAPSIIALGFSSRQEAAAISGFRFLADDAYQRVENTETRRQRLTWPERRGKPGSVLRRLARFLAASYSHVATTAIAIFFSRSAASAVIRVALGSSL
jgi:hypothetical protein